MQIFIRFEDLRSVEPWQHVKCAAVLTVFMGLIAWQSSAIAYLPIANANVCHSLRYRTADVRERKATREQFTQVEAEVLPLYKSLAMDWAVASEQNYRKIRMGLALSPNRRVVAADADDM